MSVLQDEEPRVQIRRLIEAIHLIRCIMRLGHREIFLWTGIFSTRVLLQHMSPTGVALIYRLHCSSASTGVIIKSICRKKEQYQFFFPFKKMLRTFSCRARSTAPLKSFCLLHYRCLRAHIQCFKTYFSPSEMYGVAKSVSWFSLSSFIKAV